MASKVFAYRNPKAEERLVLEGNESDYVIGDDNGTDVIMLVPKDDKHWYIGTGMELKTILKTLSDNVVITIRQYKNTKDYYITIYDLNGNCIQVSDSNESEFISLEKINKDGNKSTKYYAYIKELDENYWLELNGEKKYIGVEK